MSAMKPSVVADEMFPEGSGPYMDIEEVQYALSDILTFIIAHLFMAYAVISHDFLIRM